MFVLKSLGKLLLGGSQAADILVLEQGELWKLQHRFTGKGTVISRTRVYSQPPCAPISCACRAKTTTLVLRREDADFAYCIYVKDEEEDEEIPEMRFKISAALAFRRATSSDGEDRGCFVWRDVRYGDNDKTEYEFVWPADASDSTVQLFHLTTAQCLYEALNRRLLDDSTETEIKKLMVTEGGEAAGAAGVPSLNIEGRIVFKSDLAGFYVFDSATNTFLPRVGAAVAYISEPPTARKNAYEYVLSVLEGETSAIVHQQAIDPDATLHSDRSTGSFIWCHYTKDGLVWTYSLKFNGAAPLMAFSNAIGQAIYESLNKESFAKVDAAEARFVLNPFTEDVDMAGPEDELEAEDSDRTESEAEEEHSEDESMVKTSKDKNAQLAVGYKYDRSFVSRGSTIGVFKHTDDKLQLHANIDKVKTSSGKLFTPSKMMLHEEDTSLLLMNPDDKHKIFKMDLDRGQIVEEWNVHSDAQVSDIIPDSKYAQMTAAKTLIGFNDNSVFRIDPRLAGSKRVDDQMKQYVVKNKFSAGATTGKGEVALASAKGEIRLFDKIDKRAKTLLPGFGDAITGIDVTDSGRLIVATCKNYLLLISTEIDGDVLGFTKSMGSEKPAPKRLQLKPEHVAYMGTGVSFTPARFSTGSSEERSIITSTGQYVITWNLRRVKQGHLYDYQIKRYNDTVVADNFRYGQDRNIVVTLPDHVTMISKKSLSAPSPSAFGKSRSNIVQSRY